MAVVELFAGWLTQVVKANLIDAATSIAINEKDERRLHVLRVLKTGTEFIIAYRARLEYHDTRDLFLSLSGIRKFPSSANWSRGIVHSTRENKTDLPAERQQPLRFRPPMKDENLEDERNGLHSLGYDAALDNARRSSL